MKRDFSIPNLGECRHEAPPVAGFYVGKDDGILVDARVSAGKKFDESSAFMELAGPRKRIFFDPPSTHAAIVTCGGLCPGLNDVIRGVTMVLWYRYGVRKISGLRYGYEGLVENLHKAMPLDPEVVEDIHKLGGTILGSSRGPQDTHKMVDFLVNNMIDILFTVGGDGTQAGALAIAREIKRRNLDIVVVGIPKTIDNDISYTERTFGFETAVAMSQA
ncbi:MAG: ATP-dependent 6-phosphofructokinase, partial [Lentisphaerae bacterium]|nr:ATP-dependent 6-phosphofructokinase [Lentisphaerota bacterium]